MSYSGEECPVYLDPDLTRSGGIEIAAPLRARPMHRTNALAVALLLGLGACGDRPASDNGLGDRLAQLQSRLAALEARTSPDGLDARLAQIESRLTALDAKGAPPPVVVAAVPEPPKALTDAARLTTEALRTQRLSLDYTDADPSVVVASIVSSLSRVDVKVSPRIAATPPITLQVDDVSAYDALEVLAAKGAVRWRVDEAGVVEITASGE
jgi:hypothetical protein